MSIHIRNAELNEYDAAEAIMKQVHQMHVDWRPDIYRHCESVLPMDMYTDYGFTDKSINMELL